jgi:hypothetical protein
MSRSNSSANSVPLKSALNKQTSVNNNFPSIKNQSITSSSTFAPPVPTAVIPPVADTESNEKLRIKQVSFLDPYSLRWINKRRGINTGANIAVQITPHKFNQLRDMFQGLDFDGGGEIDFEEFKNAVEYVEKKTNNKSMLSGDPKKIFKLMDADGSGSVDFKEFLNAMTSDMGGGLNASIKDMSRMQAAFYEFANIHRRQNILDKITDNKADDVLKCEEFIKLFQIEYISNIGDELSPEEQVGKAAEDMRKERKELGKDYWDKKRLELARARAADVYLRTSKSFSTIGRPSSMSKLKPLQTMSNKDLNKIATDMADFSLQKKSFIPICTTGGLRMKARTDGFHVIK